MSRCPAHGFSPHCPPTAECGPPAGWNGRRVWLPPCVANSASLGGCDDAEHDRIELERRRDGRLDRRDFGAMSELVNPRGGMS